MSYSVFIRDNNTKEVREYVEEREWSSDYIWSEGNYSCDCNRAVFFAEAGKEDVAPAWEQPCGDCAYSFIDIKLENGNSVWPKEFS